MMRIIIIGAVLIFGVLFILSFTNKDDTVINPKPTTPVATAKVYGVVDINDLADDFDANSVSATDRWHGKLIKFSGVISNITQTGIQFSNVARKEFSLTSILCKIADKDQITPLVNEQTVTVQGQVNDQRMGIIEITDCEVVK